MSNYFVYSLFLAIHHELEILIQNFRLFVRNIFARKMKDLREQDGLTLLMHNQKHKLRPKKERKNIILHP